MRKNIGLGTDGNNEEKNFCPEFEIKLEIPESKVHTPKTLELLNG